MSSPSQQPVILLVEDSEDDAYFFARALRQSGFSAPFAHAMDGRAAIEHVRKVIAGELPVPDFIFLDLKIPISSGFEVLEWIRAQHLPFPLDISVLSGSEHASDVERAMALGATAYYVKPILVQQLKSRLGAWHQAQASHAPPEAAHLVAGPNGPA